MNLDAQIALDKFVNGESNQQFTELLARQNGIDPATVKLISRSIDTSLPLSQLGITSLRMIGRVDPIRDWDELLHRYYTAPTSGEEQADRPATLASTTSAHADADVESSTRAQAKVFHPVNTPPAESLCLNAALPSSSQVVDPAKERVPDDGSVDDSFLYKDLSVDNREIRLLRFTDTYSEGASCTFELYKACLDTAPPFYALSYVWGDPADTLSMFSNEKSRKITSSLAIALKRCWMWKDNMYLWADGVCIDQLNPVERGHQVRLMGDIYRRASKVLAHLGQPCDQVNNEPEAWSAVSLMNYLNRIWDSESEHKGPSSPNIPWQQLGVPELDHRAIWMKLLLFWLCPWFTRAWVLQEAVLGKDVVIFFGTATCNLRTVTRFWHFTQHRELPELLKRGVLSDTYAVARNLSQIRLFQQLRDKDSLDASATLLDLLSLSRTNGATDKRDKVYALLGLAQDPVANSIIPDYSPGNTVANVYTALAERYIETGDGVALLHQAGRDHLIPDLPSWVPDWSHRSRSDFTPHLYSCTGPTVPRLSLGPFPGSLSIRGAIIDMIRYPNFACRYYNYKHFADKLAPVEGLKKQPPVTTDYEAGYIVWQTARLLWEKF